MTSQRSTVLKLYKTLLYMGKDYPQGYKYFRDRCHQEFMKNSKETDSVKIARMIRYGNYIVRELEALYKLRKYRAMKNRYYKEDIDELNKILQKINQEPL